MISAKQFAAQNSVWQRASPTLEQVVRWANTHQASLGTAVAAMSTPDRHALLSELAFHAAAQGYQRWVSGPYGVHVQSVRGFIKQLPGGGPASADVTVYEWLEVQGLASVIVRFTDGLESKVFSPKIPGCGVVEAATADVMAPHHLVEIKSVTRAFRSSDLRQALTYVAMLYASGIEVTEVTLLNPRRARHVTLSLDFIAAGSGGLAAPEMLQELVEAMTGLQVSA